MTISFRTFAASLLTLTPLLLAGCALAPEISGPVTVRLANFQGGVHGGQQPVSGATIRLVEAATTGYGALADNTLLNVAVTTDASGGFSITGAYTCHTGSDPVYLVATGGNPGLGGAQGNSALALIAALGRCDAVPSIPFISVNELSTVAAVWAAAPFMTGLYGMSTSPSNTAGLANAMATATRLVSLSTGKLGGPGLPAGANLPVSEINTLADILATCINTVDKNSSGTPSDVCQSLFTATTVGGIAPTNTLDAALNLAHNPTIGLALSSSASATSPFQPTLTAPPTSWTIAINYTGGGLSNPRGIAADPAGNVWAVNRNNDSVAKFDPSGTPLSGTSGFTTGPLRQPSAIAIDTSGNAWIANSGNNTVTLMSGGGTLATSFAGDGLNIPRSLAIDATGNVWIANSGANTVSEFSGDGAPLSNPAGFSGGGLLTPVGIVIDPQ